MWTGGKRLGISATGTTAMNNRVVYSECDVVGRVNPGQCTPLSAGVGIASRSRNADTQVSACIPKMCTDGISEALRKPSNIKINSTRRPFGR